RNRPARFAAAILAFYVTVYAVITFNNLFSTSFISAVLLALVMVRLLAWRTKSLPILSSMVKRLSYVVAVSLVLAFLYTFYVYEPARANLFLLESIVDRIAALFLPTETTETFNPYTGAVFRAWISPYAFLLLTVSNWLMLLVSGT